MVLGVPILKYFKVTHFWPIILTSDVPQYKKKKRNNNFIYLQYLFGYKTNDFPSKSILSSQVQL